MVRAFEQHEPIVAEIQQEAQEVVGNSVSHHPALDTVVDGYVSTAPPVSPHLAAEDNGYLVVHLPQSPVRFEENRSLPEISLLPSLIPCEEDGSIEDESDNLFNGPLLRHERLITYPAAPPSPMPWGHDIPGLPEDFPEFSLDMTEDVFPMGDDESHCWVHCADIVCTLQRWEHKMLQDCTCSTAQKSLLFTTLKTGGDAMLKAVMLIFFCAFTHLDWDA